MNVLEAYMWQMSGKGVVVSILDDGIEKDHPDLVKNYVRFYFHFMLSIILFYDIIFYVSCCPLQKGPAC